MIQSDGASHGFVFTDVLSNFVDNLQACDMCRKKKIKCDGQSQLLLLVSCSSFLSTLR